MREATDGYKAYLYCQAILNAESEEEIAALREEVINEYRSHGYSEDEIKEFLNRLDDAVEKLESGEYYLGEDYQIHSYDELSVSTAPAPTEELVQTTQPVVNNDGSLVNTKAGIGLGVTGALIVACLAVKKIILKNNKSRRLK